MKRPLEWQVASVKAIRQETPRVKTFALALPNWMPHRPGQHYDLRLTASDGYQAQRSYSIASEPERTGEIALTIERSHYQTYFRVTTCRRAGSGRNATGNGLSSLSR